MPAYDFACESCRNEFEIWGSVEEYSKGLVKKCPFCGSKEIEQKLNALKIMTSKKNGSGGLPAAVRNRDPDAAVKQRRMAGSKPFFDGKGIMKAKDADVPRYAQILSAMGTEPRLRIMRLLLSAHPGGMIVGDIQAELGIQGSTLSHHLEKLKNVGLARVQREHCCLWYSANTEILQELLAFLYEECCSKSRAVKAEKIFQKCK